MRDFARKGEEGGQYSIGVPFLWQASLLGALLVQSVPFSTLSSILSCIYNV